MDSQHDSEIISPATIETPSGENSRRSFLKFSALGSVPAMLAMTTVASARYHKPPKKPNPPVMRPTLPELYDGANSRIFNEIRSDENTHVAELIYVLGASARPKPTFQSLETATPKEFAALALAFENAGVGAYLQAGYYINNKTYGFVANQIALVEAYHAGYLNALADSPLVPNANHYANGLTVSQIVTAVSPFIVSLNGGPTPGYMDIQSDANDTNILNFALLLEFLEQEFYNINVPKYFPV